MNQLSDYGCTDDVRKLWQDHPSSVDPGLRLARVTADFGTTRTVALPDNVAAELSGSLAHYTDQEGQPKVGDWVAVRLFDAQRPVIEAVLPRHSEIARRAPGHKIIKQVVAANVDLAFVLLSLDVDLNIERLRRYLYQLSIHGIQTVIVLNKADKANDVADSRRQLTGFGMPIIVTNALTGNGTDKMLSFIKPGKTAILLGSSGAGKSTLTNWLLGRTEQATQPVRGTDMAGRHTTVHREMFQLPQGGLLIDTPGVRELQLWGTEDDLDDTYDDIVRLSSQCSYANCRHDKEAGCAIQAALNDGGLEVQRYASYRKLKAELASLSDKRGVIAGRRNKKSIQAIRRQDGERLRDLDAEY